MTKQVCVKAIVCALLMGLVFSSAASGQPDDCTGHPLPPMPSKDPITCFSMDFSAGELIPSPQESSWVLRCVGTAEGIDCIPGTDSQVLLMCPVSPRIPKSMFPRPYPKTPSATDIVYDFEGTAEGINRDSRTDSQMLLMFPVSPRIPIPMLPPPPTPPTRSAKGITPELPPAPPRVPKHELPVSGNEIRLFMLWNGQTRGGLDPVACPGHYIGQ